MTSIAGDTSISMTTSVSTVPGANSSAHSGMVTTTCTTTTMMVTTAKTSNPASYTGAAIALKGKAGQGIMAAVVGVAGAVALL